MKPRKPRKLYELTVTVTRHSPEPRQSGTVSLREETDDYHEALYLLEKLVGKAASELYCWAHGISDDAEDDHNARTKR